MNNEGWTALMSVAAQGITQVATILLENGAKVDLKRPNGATALRIACEHGENQVARVLVRYNAVVDAGC